jgi:hypothetical protein
MPYKPTGRPAGRPRTSTLTALTVKLPEDLLLAAVVEARLAQTTLAALLREGLAWRLTQTAADRADRRAQCAMMRHVLSQEDAEAARAREEQAREDVARIRAQQAASQAAYEAKLAAGQAELKARREQEAAAFMDQIDAMRREVAPPELTQRSLGIVATIVRALAPAHPEGVTATDVLTWCHAEKVSWATLPLVEQALETLLRDHRDTGYADLIAAPPGR